MSDTASEKGIPRMTPEHDADVAYQEAHVKGTRKDCINAPEYPALEAEIIRLGEVRTTVRSLASGSYTLIPTDELNKAYQAASSLAYSHPHLGTYYADLFDRWLSPSTLDTGGDK